MKHSLPDASLETHLRLLAETLACEYAGAVSAQNVVRAVSETARTMGRLNLDDSLFWELTEQNARRELTNILARG